MWVYTLFTLQADCAGWETRVGRVGPDALVWAAGRQPGGTLLRDSRLQLGK